MPKVLNKHMGSIPDDAVYIGRPSKWGNPFVVGRHGSRKEVIAKYEKWIKRDRLMDDIHELRGKDLVCWCSPAPCHGDVLIRLANEGYDG